MICQWDIPVEVCVLKFLRSRATIFSFMARKTDAILRGVEVAQRIQLTEVA